MTRPERAPAPKRAKSTRVSASAAAEAKAAIAPPQLDAAWPLETTAQGGAHGGHQ